MQSGLLLAHDNLNGLDYGSAAVGRALFLISIPLTLLAASVLAGRKQRRRKPRPRPERPLW